MIYSTENCYRCKHCTGFLAYRCNLHETETQESAICDSFSYDGMCMNCKHWKKSFDPLTQINGFCKLKEELMWNNDPACDNFNVIDE